MKITKILNTHPMTLASILSETFKDSRFKVEVQQKDNSIVLSKIRLNMSKDYCGNHAKACERPGKKDKKASFLEGADWIEFNDTLNNVLDLGGISATIQSTVVDIRKGYSRRIQYDSDTFIGSPNNGEWKWNKTAPDNHWKSCENSKVKKNQWSKFPKGTPGIHMGINYSVKG